MYNSRGHHTYKYKVNWCLGEKGSNRGFSPMKFPWDYGIVLILMIFLNLKSSKEIKKIDQKTSIGVMLLQLQLNTQIFGPTFQCSVLVGRRTRISSSTDTSDGLKVQGMLGSAMETGEESSKQQLYRHLWHYSPLLCLFQHYEAQECAPLSTLLSHVPLFLSA